MAAASWMWRVLWDASGVVRERRLFRIRTAHEVAKRQGTIGLASAQHWCPARVWTFFWRINQFPCRSISAAGERAAPRPRPNLAPTKAGNCRGTCSAPHGRTTACSDGDIKEPGLNGCVRDGSFSTTAKPFQGRTLMTTWMSSGKLEPILFAKEPCDFPFPLLSHTPINSFSPLSFDSSRSISSSSFRGGHECIAWPP